MGSSSRCQVLSLAPTHTRGCVVLLWLGVKIDWLGLVLGTGAW
jgi:hypothetical protein